MTEVGYKGLLYVLEADLKNDIDLRWLVFVCGERIPEERRENIKDVLDWFKELEKSGNLGIDNLGFLKEVLEGLEKHSCLDKVAAFEKKRRHEALPVYLQNSIESSRLVVSEIGEREDNSSAASLTQEQKDEGLIIQCS